MNSKAEPVVAEADSSKSVVLVVEDEPILRALSVAVVEIADLEAVEAGNADEAIQILESMADIRVVFTDVRMPGSMDGIILARTIRRRWPHVRLILTSGEDEVGIGLIPERARFFTKPYSTNQVIESLRQMAA
jgi:two-component system, response regulator PdtaR